MQTLLIGDIHGCEEELKDLLDKAALTSGDEIIALGDFVDRGPATPQVLEFFRTWPGAKALMGNHERKHIRGAAGEVKLAQSQIISRAQFGADYPGALDFMRSLPVFIDLPEALLVHGCYEPGVALEQQLPAVLCGTMSGTDRLALRYAQPWYELYDGPKPIVCAHHDYTRNGQPLVYASKVFALDTSCVHGGALTGLLLPEFRIVSVPSRGNHWARVRREYARQAEQAAKPVRAPQPPGPHAIPEAELEGLIERIQREHSRLSAELLARPDFGGLSPRQQALAYNERIGGSPDAALLHLARRGQLSAETVRKVLRMPPPAD